MTRPTLKNLAYKLFMASRTIRRDKYYRHQASGKVYKVTGYAILEATGEALVLYRPAEVNRAPDDPLGAYERPEAECVFARPAEEFNDIVEFNVDGVGRTGLRFKRVRKVESWTDA